MQSVEIAIPSDNDATTINLTSRNSEEQFGAYWHRDVSRKSDLWYKMIYCIQFQSLCKRIESFENNPQAHAEEIDRRYARAEKFAKLRYLYMYW